MTELEKLTAGAVIRGLLGSVEVTILSAKWQAHDRLNVVFLDDQGFAHDRVLGRKHEKVIELVKEDRTPSVESSEQLIIKKRAESPDKSPLNLQAKSKSNIHQTSLDQLQVSKRTSNALIRAGIQSVEQLYEMTWKQVEAIHGIGTTSLQELQQSICASIGKTWPQIKEVDKSNSQPIAQQDTDTSLKVLGLSRRAYNALFRSGIQTIQQLISLSDEQLLHIRNVGQKSQDEIRAKLATILNQRQELIVVPITAEDRPAPDSATMPLIAQERVDSLKYIPLDDIDIQRLGLLQEDCENLRSEKVNSVLALCNTPASRLVNVKSLRHKVEWYLTWIEGQVFETWLMETKGDTLAPYHVMVLSQQTLEQLTKTWLREFLSERASKIIALYFGLYGAKHTLAEVGKEINVTRERVRQIRDKALVKLRQYRAREAVEPLRAVIRHIISQQGGVIQQSHLNETVDRIDFIRRGKLELSGMLQLCYEVDREFQCIKPWSVYSSTTLKEVVPSAIQELEDIVKPHFFPQAPAEIISWFRKSGTFEQCQNECTIEFLLACLKAHPDLLFDDQGRVKHSRWSNKIVDEVYMALREMGKPAHFTDITKKTNLLLREGSKTNVRAVHGTLGRYPEVFVRVGHGVFGLSEWGLHDDGNLANAVDRVLREAGQPLHIDRITREVLKTWYVRPESVYAAIQQNEKRFVALGSGVFWLKERLQQQKQGQNRINFDTVFGAQLARWQEELDKRADLPRSDTLADVDKLDAIGKDFFG